MRHVLLAIGLVYILFAPAIGAAESTDYPRPHLLIQPQELARFSGDSGLVILDIRSAEAFAAGHVPGAQRVDHSVWKQAFGDGQDARRWSQMIGDLGITRETPVVIYDDNSSKNAARIWWILKYWGVEDARLLNGGWTGWKSGNHPVSTDVAAEIHHAGFRPLPNESGSPVKRMCSRCYRAQTFKSSIPDPRLNIAARNR